MTRSEKRALAQKAFDFYRLAADSLQFALENGTLEEDGLDTQDWHLHMMLGKCFNRTTQGRDGCEHVFFF